MGSQIIFGSELENTNSSLIGEVTISLSVTGKQTILVVPPGKELFIMCLIIKNPTVPLGTQNFRFGFNANADDVLPNRSYGTLNSPNQYLNVFIDKASPKGIAGDVFGLQVNSTQAASIDVSVIGQITTL